MTDSGHFAKQPSVPIALTIAGSDSGGGAGLQADLKTFHQMGVTGTSVVVAVTAQNTLGVQDVHVVPPANVRAQIDSVAVDLSPTATKTGMLANAPVAETVVDRVRAHALPNLVVDPVMVATSGDRLLDDDAIEIIRSALLPLAMLITPNLFETKVLTGKAITDPGSMEQAGHRLCELGAAAALIKGGHLAGDMTVDVLVTAGGVEHFRHRRIDTVHTHGTGCTLSAAITAGLALGVAVEQAVRTALDFVHTAIETAPGIGAGHGPLNHFAPVPSR